MLVERLRYEWRAREHAGQIEPAVVFSPHGLVMGAGTVLIPAESDRKLKPLAGQEERVLALLSVAYGRAVPPTVLGHTGGLFSNADDGQKRIHIEVVPRLGVSK